jgi:ABC-2 type transport system permease protein
MKKMLAVFKREYLQAVRKKMFIVMTFLMPVFMIALFVLPAMLMQRGMGEKKVAILDGTGMLREAFSAAPKAQEGNDSPLKRRELPQDLKIEYHDLKGINTTAASPEFLDRLTKGEDDAKLDAVFVVPPDALTSTEAKLKFYSRSATDIITQERLSSAANDAIHERRLAERGIAKADLDKLMAKLGVDAVQLSKSGEEKKGGEANFIVGFILTGLLIIPSFVYGTEIMRGIIQEKTDRVVEVLVSSMSPSQLLVGKILGIAAVGLTQISVWLAMGAGAGVFAASVAAFAGEDFLQLIRPSTFAYFVVFFILAYLTYVCVYAIGGAVCNSDKEAQQLIAPISMIMMLPWFLLVGIITNPDSTFSVAFSLAPVFGPMTMYVRTLVAEPPVWHIALSIAIAIATISAFFWVTAKIFRIGILSYGKRPTIPEMWRWIRVA